MLSSRPGGLATTGPRRAFVPVSNNNINFDENQFQSSKTPGKLQQKTPAGKTPGKRRALGDISNQKGVSQVKQQPLQKLQSGTVTKTQTKRLNVTFAPSSLSAASKPQQQQKQQDSKSLALLPTRTRSFDIMTSTTANSNASISTSVPPVEDVEFRAGRPFDPLQDDDDFFEDLSMDFDDLVAPIVPRKHTPSFWMIALSASGGEAPLVYDDDDIINNDPYSSMDDDSPSKHYRVNLSLEDDVLTLGESFDEISF